MDIIGTNREVFGEFISKYWLFVFAVLSFV